MISINPGASRVPGNPDGGEQMTGDSSQHGHPARAAVARLCWSRRFPGTPEQVAGMRHWLRELLPPCNARDDLLAIASELASNAVRHTHSRRPGGAFGVEVSWCP